MAEEKTDIPTNQNNNNNNENNQNRAVSALLAFANPDIQDYVKKLKEEIKELEVNYVVMYNCAHKNKDEANELRKRLKTAKKFIDLLTKENERLESELEQLNNQNNNEE